MNIGDEFLEERSRRRRAGDPRLSAEGKELFRRMATGDLAGELQAALNGHTDADPLLGGSTDDARSCRQSSGQMILPAQGRRMRSRP